VISEESPRPEIRLEIGRSIATARSIKGLTIGELADRLKLRDSFISAIEEGRGGQYMVWAYERIHLQTIARILDINLEPILESELDDSGK